MYPSASIALALLACSPAFALVNYCNTNTFVSASSHMQFTKEVSVMEYAVGSKFKSLHCCAKGYRSIEWFKDSRAYPWPSDESSFILYPEAANQTIYTQRASLTDRGNYTCIVSNVTHVHVHTIMLDVVDKPPDAPRATFTPADQWVELGGPARLYCEAFVGRINLPDARSDVWWSRVKPQAVTTTTTQPRQLRLQQDKVTREDEQILGAYLFISKVKSEDYGQYICTVGNAESYIQMPIWLHHKAVESMNEPKAIPWRSLCFVIVGLILAGLTLVVLYAKLGLKMALKFRNIFSSTPLNDGKEYDVLVVYTPPDSHLVTDLFVPTLQDKYNYKCVAHQVPIEACNWNIMLSELVRQSRSLVAVLSPDRYSALQLDHFFGQLHSYGIQPVAILLQNLPDIDYSPKNEVGHSLLAHLRKTKLMAWRHAHDKHFWLNLRLVLPLPSVCFVAADNGGVEMPRLDVIRIKKTKEIGTSCDVQV